jgi:hypothetical protein
MVKNSWIFSLFGKKSKIQGKTGYFSVCFRSVVPTLNLRFRPKHIRLYTKAQEGNMGKKKVYCRGKSKDSQRSA